MSSVNLKMDPVTGRSRGFAFIVFATEEVLTALLEQEHAIKGKKVAVKKAASKQARMNLYCTPWTWTLSVMQKSDCGEETNFISNHM